MRGLVVVVLALAALVGCTPAADVAAEPVWGKQACGHCGMVVSEVAPSAQATLPGGERKFFDDVGCLAEWLDRTGAKPVGAWVRKGDGWVHVHQARFQQGVPTPMDFGFVGADEGVDWAAVQAAVRAKAAARGGGR